MIVANLPNPWGSVGNVPRMIVVHAMGEWIDQPNGDDYYAPYWLSHHENLSAHALIAPSGVIIRTRKDFTGAWHARGHNDNTLAVEFLVPGLHTYETFLATIAEPWVTPAQLGVGLDLVQSWMTEHDIIVDDVVRHSDLSPGRKHDPGAGFPWAEFRDRLLEATE